MSPDFSAAVDPIFTYVLSVMDQIESGSPPAADHVSNQLRNLIDAAETRLGNRSDWNLAKYALAALADDLLIEAPWEGRAWWEENRLEFKLFRSGDAFTAFYLKAQEANEVARKDALEVFYVAVVLGFRGIYGDQDATQYATDFGLPDSLEDWAKRTATSIQLGQGRPRLLEQSRPVYGAPPLEGKYLLIGSAMFFLILLAIAILLALQIF